MVLNVFANATPSAHAVEGRWSAAVFLSVALTAFMVAFFRCLRFEQFAALAGFGLTLRDEFGRGLAVKSGERNG